MWIKRLEIYGFKSFPHRVTLPFPKGISAIVGPNGSGKSNIIDAIRWVLGEQNPRRLRVREMSDIIFASQNSRGPNFAEVRLVLENEEGKAPKELANLPEIVITRRLYRHGDSEYLLNNRPCRLKDIVYLFLDTGAHPRAYGIIDQGQVGQFVEQSPKERRSFLEELAGVARYKMRREETTRQLARTRENLTRLKDILLEVEAREKELVIQAEEAKVYLSLQERLKDLEIERLARLYQETLKKETAHKKAFEKERVLVESLRSRQQEIEPERDELAARIELLRQELEKEEAGCHQKERIFRQVSKELSDLLREEAESSGAIERLESDLAHGQERLSIIKERLRELRLVMGKNNQKLNKTKEELAGLKTSYVSFHQERTHLEKALSTKRKELSKVKAEITRLKERLNSLREAYQKVLSEREKIQNKLRSLIEEEKTLLPRREEIENSLKETSKKRERHLLRLKTAEKDLEKAVSQEEEFRQELGQRLLEIKDLEHEKGLLERFLEKEALPEAIQHLKKAGVSVKTLAESLSLSPEEEHLADRVLDQVLTAVIAEDREKALKLASFLRENDLAGHILWLKHAPGEFVRRRLAKVSQVNSLEEALNAPQKTFTPDGFEVDSDGLISYRPSKKTAGLLSKRRRLEEVKGLLHQAREREKLLAEQQKRLAEEITKLKETLKLEKQGLKEASEKEEKLKSDLAELALKEKALKEKKQFFEERLVQIEQELEKISNDQKEIEGGLKTFKGQSEDLLSEIQDLETQLARVKAQLKGAYSQERVLELELSALKERLTQAEAEEGRLLKEEADLSAETERLLRNLREKKTSLQALRNRLSETRQQAKTLEEGLKAQKEELSQKKALIRELERRLAEVQQESERLSQGLSRAKERLHRREIDLAEIELTLAHLRDQARERFGVELDHVSLSGEKKKDQLEAEIQALRERLREFQAVNLAAIEELKKVRKRRAFLLDQEKDLEKAITDLEQAVQRINQTCRDRLRKALATANEKLKVVFPLLFPGGEASLKFVHSEDPLEAGLDLEVRLPGKPIRHLAMLSGGEKALTALGVLCAFYLVKPGPFCVLDEVDASLDEANIERFTKLLQELAKHSQIILVTHNKRVMEAAEALFGVTMEEKGVSKLISVRLTDQELSRP